MSEKIWFSLTELGDAGAPQIGDRVWIADPETQVIDERSPAFLSDAKFGWAWTCSNPQTGRWWSIDGCVVAFAKPPPLAT